MNHPALGSVAEWLHCYVAGLRPECGRLEVRPYPGGVLKRAATTTRLGGRLAAVEWSIKGDVFSVSCTVPQGVDATVFVPATAPGPAHRDGWDVYRRGPGDWEFEASWTPAEWRPGDAGPGVLYGTGV